MTEPIVYIIASAVVAAIVAGIAARDVIWKKGSTKWISFTRAGYAFIILSAALVMLPSVLFVVQGNSDKNERDHRDSLQRVEYRKSVDSLAKRFGDSNYRTLTVIAKILHDQKDSLDIDNARIYKLMKDSGNVKEVLPDQPLLQLMVMPEGKEGFSFLKYEDERYHYRINFLSEDGESCCFNLKISAVVLDSAFNRYAYISPLKSPLTGIDELGIGGSYQTTFWITHSLPFDYLFLWVRGTYKDRQGKRLYTIDRVYYNRKNANSYGAMQGNIRKGVIDVVQTYEK
jgi:hypothetical protein